MLADLTDRADAVGDQVRVDEQLSVARETPFIWLNGEVILGEGLTRHSGVLNEQGEITELARRRLSFAAGHVCGRVAVIEQATCTNVDPADVVADVLTQLDVDKVYLADTALHPLCERAAGRGGWRR